MEKTQAYYYRKSPGYFAQEKYNKFADTALRENDKILGEAQGLYEVKETTDENGEPTQEIEFNYQKAPEVISKLQARVKELTANCIGYISQAQAAATHAEEQDARVAAFESGDIWENRSHPFVMGFKDSINRLRRKEVRKKMGLNLGHLGLLFLLIPCIEGDSNILVNRTTGYPFQSAKEIAEFLGENESNTRNRISGLLRKGILYRPPGLNKVYAVEETILRCGKDNAEAYRKRHGMIKAGARKTKAINLDNEQNDVALTPKNDVVRHLEKCVEKSA